MTAKAQAARGERGYCDVCHKLRSVTRLDLVPERPGRKWSSQFLKFCDRCRLDLLHGKDLWRLYNHGGGGFANTVIGAWAARVGEAARTATTSRVSCAKCGHALELHVDTPLKRGCQPLVEGAKYCACTMFVLRPEDACVNCGRGEHHDAHRLRLCAFVPRSGGPTP